MSMGILDTKTGQIKPIKKVISDGDTHIGYELSDGQKILNTKYGDFLKEKAVLDREYRQQAASLTSQYEQALRDLWVKTFETVAKEEVIANAE
jgi:hypothetical protein